MIALCVWALIGFVNLVRGIIDNSDAQTYAGLIVVAVAACAAAVIMELGERK